MLMFPSLQFIKVDCIAFCIVTEQFRSAATLPCNLAFLTTIGLIYYFFPRTLSFTYNSSLILIRPYITTNFINLIKHHTTLTKHITSHYLYTRISRELRRVSYYSMPRRARKRNFSREPVAQKQARLQVIQYVITIVYGARGATVPAARQYQHHGCTMVQAARQRQHYDGVICTL